MSVDTFKPEVWAANLLVALRKALVFGRLANRNYEGLIREVGDTVTINSVSRPTIKNYEANKTEVKPEKLTTAQRKLRITEAKYFAFEVDDVDKRQAMNGLIAKAIAEAAYGLADVADQFLAALWTGVVSANNIGEVAVKATEPTKAYDDVLVPLKVALDDANVPTEGRWVTIAPWIHGRLLRDDRFIRADATGKAAASARGMVGEAAGFTINVTNNSPNPEGDDNIVMAGVQEAMSYADQINEVEAYRPESSFSDAVKGLHTYGGKLVRPEQIAVAQVSQT